ncbi:adenine phosphoribosyltransferase [Rhodococcoides trifolii]|uniref:Adenine phosphoribosyltransferase n=1 Tax=Rhodococcoides trifolii TaxID=908250 RepID=A0A917FWM8_9NOCA|nr:adenine phosphoribosyltransferase [Rhodococcus trifolii]GGG08941.1 adenine phosphoribosyltransferase [Rhodococcus trifolii]
MTSSAPGTEAQQAVTRLTRWADDFPEKGVRFADLTPVFADAAGLRAVVDALAEAGREADLVAGIDARGFLLGAGVALALGTGVLAVRKAGKLPPPVHSESYDLEYGTARLEVPADTIDLTGRRVLVVDDVLATGGTLVAARDLLTRCGAEVVGAAVVLEIGALNGRTRWGSGALTALSEV